MVVSMQELMNNYYQVAFDEANLMVAIISKDKMLITANKVLLDFANVNLEDIIDIPYFELPWWQHSELLQNKVIFAFEQAFWGESVRFDATHKDYVGNLHELDFIIKPILKNNSIDYYIAMGYNITDLVNTRKALTQRERQIQAFFEYSSEGYFFCMLPEPVTIDGSNINSQISELNANLLISSYNHKLCTMVNIDKMYNKNIFPILGIKENNIINILKKTIIEKQSHFINEIHYSEDDSIKYIDITLVAIYNEDDEFEGNFGIVRDITEEIMNLNRLSTLANKDSLTGLNNRRSFFNLSAKLIDNQKEDANICTIAMMDIDHFKKVNDVYGHEAGDKVLKRVSELIQKLSGANTLCGRFGGEEFIMLIPTKACIAFDIAEAVRMAIENEPIVYNNITIYVTISIGLCNMVNTCSEDIDVFIDKADKALYYSKDTGRNRTTIYNDTKHSTNASNDIRKND